MPSGAVRSLTDRDKSRIHAAALDSQGLDTEFRWDGDEVVIDT